jgi:hypothetical protein
VVEDKHYTETAKEDDYLQLLRTCTKSGLFAKPWITEAANLYVLCSRRHEKSPDATVDVRWNFPNQLKLLSTRH